MNSENKNKPLLTVGIACYNIGSYIGRCLDSVLQQTYANLEILVVDDGSTDDSGEICDRYAEKDSRVRVIHQKNRGLGGARDVMIEAATGAWIVFLDGDDYVEPDMYELMLQAALEHDADLAVCNYFIETEDAAPETAPPKVETARPEVPVEIMDAGRLLTCLVEEKEDHVVQNAAWNKLYKTELIGDLRFVKRHYEDIAYTTKLLAKVKKGCYIHTPLLHYIVSRKGSIMGAGVSRRILTEQLPAYRERGDCLRAIGRNDLADTHEYQVIKKMLLLYTEARRSRDPEKRACMPDIAAIIRNAKKDESRLYSCAIADPHEHLRFCLFQIHPVLYNSFMDVNEGIVLPLRAKLRTFMQKP